MLTNCAVSLNFLSSSCREGNHGNTLCYHGNNQLISVCMGTKLRTSVRLLVVSGKIEEREQPASLRINPRAPSLPGLNHHRSVTELQQPPSPTIFYEWFSHNIQQSLSMYSVKSQLENSPHQENVMLSGFSDLWSVPLQFPSVQPSLSAVRAKREKQVM